MNAAKSIIRRPNRWDEPFDANITDDIVDQLLSIPPFNQMDSDAFGRSVPLRGILKNDCRILDLNTGDIIVRECDYGSSAFLILSGSAVVSLKSLPDNILGRQTTRKMGWIQAISQLWKNSKHPESRDYSYNLDDIAAIGSREHETGTRVFLHDIPRVISDDQAVVLRPGEIFGEISALTRTPRSATVVAGSKSRLLEIRWQGFRELLKQHVAMRQHVDKLYRENSLRTHLREINSLKKLPKEVIEQIANETVFESFGEFQWNHNFKSISRKDISERILSEPLIAEQGDYVNGLILIRNGFARLSRKHGDGHQTIAYLGKGDVFGLRELVHNWRTGEQTPWLLSLRAVGYVDVLRIPTDVCERLVLSNIPESVMPPPLPENISRSEKSNRRKGQRKETVDRGLMEFLVEKRFINGAQTMMIDLNRCTRCDDCVRACASTHNNNPRFIRQGEKYDHWMIANACMHCVDPVCMIGCPTGAIGRDQETGNVTINDKSCIGCATCSNSCPYDNIRMVEVNDRYGRPITDQANGDPIVKATKCDLCTEQLGGPACQRACPHDALVRIDLTNDEEITSWSKR